MSQSRSRIKMVDNSNYGYSYGVIEDNIKATCRRMSPDARNRFLKTYGFSDAEINRMFGCGGPKLRRKCSK